MVITIDVDKYITRTIANIGPLRLKMYVPLLQGKEDKPIITNWTREVNPNLTEHLYFVEGFACVSIDITDKNGIDNGLEWKKRGLTMTPKTQHIFVKAFQDILKILYSGKIFYKENGHLKAYGLQKDQIVQVFNAGTDNIFELHPAIIREDEDEYEGATLFINSTTNYVSLVLDELHALARILDKIDIFTYSQSLINMYLAYKEKAIGEKVVIKQPERQKKLFTIQPRNMNPKLEGNEIVESKMPLPNKEDEDLFKGL